MDVEAKIMSDLAATGCCNDCGCNGEGGPEDIAKGVSYLQKAKDLPEAQEELSHYKKNFFGKWVRRDKTETVLRGLLRLQSMFGSDKKEAPQLPQPSTTFDWILTIRSRLNSEDTPAPAYGQVEKALRACHGPFGAPQ